MIIVSSKRLPRRLREFVASSQSEDRPAIADIYKAGKLMGLSRKEINTLCRQSNRRTGLRSFIARHWAVLLPVTLLAIFIGFVLFLAISNYYYRSTYPSGSYYGVISPHDFEKRLFLSNTGSHT